MAVEIPVFIDIDQAFKEAASRVPQAMKPLQGYMDQNALYIKVKIDGKQTYIKDILDNSTMSARQLNQALEQVNAWISSRAKAGGYDLLGGLTQSEKLHLQVLGALEHRIHGVSDASALMGRIYTANIEKTKAQIETLTASVDTLTRKQNQYYKTVDGRRVPGGKAYERTKAQIEATNAQLVVAKKNLAALTVELSKITAGGAAAAASIGSIRTPAMEMAESWRRGAAYVDQWNQSLGVANSRLATLIKGSVSLIALHSATSFVRNIRQVTAEFEMQRVALGGIIQDTERAEQLFRQLKAAAIKSPFEIKDLVSFTKQLSAYRIETEQLFDVTMKLADVSAGLGVDMSRLVLAYGQVRAASVLRGQELRQFTEAGIPLVELLADKFKELGRAGTTTADVFELISKRAVPFSMIEDIFNDMTEAGGMFYKMQEKQSETLKGQWMKLKDALSIMYDEIGNTPKVHSAMESLLRDAMSLMQNWREVGKSIGIVLASMAAYKVYIINARIAQNALTAAEMAEVSALQLNVVGKSRLIAALAGEAAATKVQIGLSNAYVWAKSREMMATNMFTKALYKMIAAMLSNPYAAAIAAIVALVAIIVKLSRKTEEARISTEKFQKSLESFTSSNSHAKDIDNLCDKYEKLAKKADKTEEETQQLIRTSKELGKLYPQMVEGVDSQTGALKLNTDAIRANNEETKEAIRLALEQDKRKAQTSLDDLIKERDAILAQLESGKKVSEIKVGSATNRIETSLTEKDKADLGRRLMELQPQIEQFTKDIGKAEEAIEDFQEGLIGPQVPDFFGNAWKFQLSQYETTLRSSSDTVKALTKDQIEGFGNQKEAMEAIAKEYEAQTALVDFYTKALITATGARKLQTEAALKDAQDMQALYETILKDYNAMDLLNKRLSGSGSGTDPFINLMQERMKFMKDFQKGYEDLTKYMTSAQAKQEESGIMLGRGQALGISPEEQLRAVDDLSKWYEDMIKNVQDKLRAKGIKGATPTDFLSIDTTKKSKAIQDLQKLLQSLWDAKTDYDTSQKKKDIEDALKRLSEEIKQTETARNFYQDILDLTGDEQLAATMGVSIYGNIGQDFKERLQQQLNTAMNSLDANQLTDELRQAFASQDFDVILENLDKFPEEWRKRLKEMAESNQKFEADRAKDLLKSLERAKTYAEQQVELAKQTAKRTAQIQAMDVKGGVKEQLLKQNARKEAEESAKIAYEAFKDTPMYIELFSDLDQASLRMLTNMRENLEQMKGSWKNLHPRELKELQSRLNELDEQIAQRNPFKALTASIKAYYDMQKQRSSVEVEEAAISANQKLQNEEALLQVYREEYLEAVKLGKGHEADVMLAKEKMELQQEAVDAAKEESDAAQQTAYQYKNAKKHIQDAADEMQKWAGYVNDSLGGIQQIVGTFASDDFAETFDIVAEGLGKTVSGAAELGQGIAAISTGNLAGIVDVIKGLGNVISGTFGTKKELQIKHLNKKIQDQQDILDGLTYSYGRLEKAMAKAFGSDYIYNYNEQLKKLQAQQAAYEEQLRLEQNKGKKKDKEKIKDYQDSIQEVEDQILDMNGGLSEFFTGSDVRSAAEEFANSWIEAYKSFSSTTGAMRDKFQEMIGNMITQSLAGQMMQSLLQPIFNEIDKLSEDGELTATEIGSISDMAIAAIPQIDSAMTGLVNNLAGAGINLRQQAGQFTGISRDIAGASEESILGLAAAVNTANFYISHVPTISENVAAIREALTGESGGGRRNVATRGDVEGPTYEDQMLAYASAIPTMRDDMAVMRSLLERVIKPVGVSATHYVAIR